MLKSRAGNITFCKQIDDKFGNKRKRRFTISLFIDVSDTPLSNVKPINEIYSVRQIFCKYCCQYLNIFSRLEGELILLSRMLKYTNEGIV